MKRLYTVWLATFALATPAPAAEKLADGIAAQVGVDVVLVSEVMALVGPTEKAMREQGAPDSEIAKLRADGLERMIESRLIDQVVRKFELYASDAEIDQQIEDIADENSLDATQLRASVEAHGLEFDDYRERIKRQIERQNVDREFVASRVSVEEKEVRALFEERFSDQPQGGTVVHVRQILLTYGKQAGRDAATACQLASAARSRVQGGLPFQQVASEISDVARQRGGDLGWIHEDTVASWMAPVLGGLENGGMSDVVELPFGCTVLELVERKTYEPITFEEALPRLHQEVFQKYMDEVYVEWVETLRANTYIERKGHFAEAAMFSSPGSRDAGSAFFQ